jgi:hypothetical protein
MDRHTPTSPSPTRAEPLPSGFNELLQHDASTPYPRESIVAETIQVHSQPGARYGTPGPQPHHSQDVEGSMLYQQCAGTAELVGKHGRSCGPVG